MPLARRPWVYRRWRGVYSVYVVHSPAQWDTEAKSNQSDNRINLRIEQSNNQ
jgi:hypothetical protein